MISLKTFSCLVILACLLSSFSAHECHHDKLNFTFRPVEDPHPSKFLKYSASDYKNIRITFDYSNLLGKYAIDVHLFDTVIPAVKSILEASLNVIPRTEKILVPSDMIGGGVKVPVNGSTEGYDGDIVIFVSSINNALSGFTAMSWPCGYDKKTHRPIVGSIQFNSYYTESKAGRAAGYESLISTALHEITHSLGFSVFLYPYFINPETLQPLTDHLLNKTVNGVKTLVLDLPSLTKRLRTHFNCSTLEGAYLENQGTAQSAGSHFERRVFYNEIMTASSIRDKRFSEFTLAVLEGSGWYQVNYSYAEPMTYGKNQGCAFLDTKCINSTTLEPNFKEFCSPLASKGVSWTRRGYGYCGASTLKKSYLLESEFDYWGNGIIVDDHFADNCPQIQMGYVNEIDCEDTFLSEKARLDKYAEFYGYGAKAFMGTLSEEETPYSSYDGYCFKTKCEKKEDGNYNLQVLMGRAEENVLNCSAAGDVDASSFGHLRNAKLVGVLRCPNPNEFCEQVEAEGNCRGNCFGNGVCIENQCECNEGWGSYNCAERKEALNSSRCTEDSLRTTAYGNGCICSQMNITCQCALGKIYDERCPNYKKPDVIPDVVVPDEDANKEGSGRFLIPALIILALVCVLGLVLAKKKKQIPAMEESVSRAFLPKNPKESMTTL